MSSVGRASGNFGVGHPKFQPGTFVPGSRFANRASLDANRAMCPVCPVLEWPLNRYRGCAPVWPGQAPDAAWGKRPMAWASVRCGHGKRTASKLGMRPVTLRRISQHPPVTSKLGLSSRLALPAHFHRQPGFSYVWIVYFLFTGPSWWPAGRHWRSDPWADFDVHQQSECDHPGRHCGKHWHGHLWSAEDRPQCGPRRYDPPLALVPFFLSLSSFASLWTCFLIFVHCNVFVLSIYSCHFNAIKSFRYLGIVKMMLSSLTGPLEPWALPHFLTMLSSTEVDSNPGPHRHQIYEHLEEAHSRRRSRGQWGPGFDAKTEEEHMAWNFFWNRSFWCWQRELALF